MTDARQDRLRSLFFAASDLPPAERAAFLGRECQDDPALAARVLALLAQDDDGFLARPVLAGLREMPVAAADTSSFAAGTRIGPYELVRKLGDGGFGTVFEARQTVPVARTVALKLLKPGMDTEQFVARFEQERQALARMDHPHVAKVLDAGASASGRPYFVMELVPGLPIAEFCDRHRLPVGARLRLFLQVCDAVQHAHGRGILHRDLKPTNVLVAERDGAPVVKVIDFGIAKALEGKLIDRTLRTEAWQVMGTLAYMSPEQASGSPDLDIRTDVWSLGVVLHELLTGSTPFGPAGDGSSSRDEQLRRIRDEEPARPSAALAATGPRLHPLAEARGTAAERLLAAVRGELDWIVGRALEKDRARRYATAAEFAADVQRHLAGEPIVAAPPSAGYRLRKFVRRHRGTVAATAAVLLSMAGGLVAFAWQADVARQERDTAELARGHEQRARQFAEQQQQLAEASAEKERAARRTADAVVQFVTEALRSSDLLQGGRRTMLVRDAVLNASKKLDAGALRDQPDVEASLRSTIAWILVNNDGGPAALEVAQRSVAAARARHAGDSPELVKALASLGSALVGNGRAAEAKAPFDEALERHRRLEPGDTPFAVQLLAFRVEAAIAVGDFAAAEAPARDGLAMALRLAPQGNDQGAQAQGLLAFVLDRLGRRHEAVPLAEQSLATLRQVLPADSLAIVPALNLVGGFCIGRRDFERGKALLEESLSLLRAADAGGALEAQARHDLGVLLWTQNRPAEAEPLFQQALEGYRKAQPGDHPDTARTLKDLGSAWRVLGRTDDAERVLHESIDMWQRLFPGGHPEYADAIAGLSALRRATRRMPEADALAGEAITMRRRVCGPDDPALMALLLFRGDVATARNAPADAVPLFAEATGIGERALPPGHPDTAVLLLRLAHARLDAGEAAAALPLFRDWLQRTQDQPQANGTMAWALSGLARSEAATGDAAGAREAFARSLALFANAAPNGSSARAVTLLGSGRARLAANDATAALPELEAALAMARRVFGATSPKVAEYEQAVEGCRAAARK